MEESIHSLDQNKKPKRWVVFPRATLLGRLARDLSCRGERLGDLLLVSALSRALVSTGSVGAVAVVTDPKNAKAADFYRRHGFRELGAGKRMYLPMVEIETCLGEVGPE